VKAFVAVGLFLSAMQVSAMAQDEFRALNGAPLPTTVLRVDKSEAYDEMTIGLRIPFLGGRLDNQGDKWRDVFNSSGVGFGLDGSFLWTVSGKVALGIYTAFDIDVFGGKSTTVDLGSGPVKESQDDLVMTRFLVGGRIRETFGIFFMDQNIGLGFATYGASNATASGVTVGVIDPSFVFAFELGVRFGFVVSRVVDLGMGLAWNYNGAPNISSDLSQVDPTLHFLSQSNTLLTFFININF